MGKSATGYSSQLGGRLDDEMGRKHLTGYREGRKKKKKLFLFLTFTNLHFRVTNGAFDLILHLRERANSIVTEAFWCKDL